MASKKNLKKDVNYLTDEVIGTCLMHQFANNKANHEKVDKLIDDMLVAREDTINKINQPELSGEKKVKTYYNEVFNEFIEKVNDTFETLNKMDEQ